VYSGNSAPGRKNTEERLGLLRSPGGFPVPGLKNVTDESIRRSSLTLERKEHLKTSMSRHEMLQRASDLVSSCEHGHERLGYITGGEFLDLLSVPSVSQDGLCSMKLTVLFFRLGRYQTECAEGESYNC
jgi:hypothetical protein